MATDTTSSLRSCIQVAADIVAAYVSNNSVPAAELRTLISGVYSALLDLGHDGASGTPTVEKPTPAQIRKSITHDALISFEDGRPYKTLRRHLTIRGLTPEAYRKKWGLPLNYPMTAASYSETRSTLARSFGLGQQRRKAAAKPANTVETSAEAPKKRGNKKDA